VRIMSNPSQTVASGLVVEFCGYLVDRRKVSISEDCPLPGAIDAVLDLRERQSCCVLGEFAQRVRAEVVRTEETA